MILAAEDFTTATGGLTTTEQALSVLRSLTPAERKGLPKVGPKYHSLALDIIELGRQNPDLIPRGIDFAKIDRDITAYGQSKSLLTHSQRLTGRLLDTKMLLGTDIYLAALAIYHSLKRNAQTDSLQDAIGTIKRGFAKVRQTEPEPEVPGGTVQGEEVGSGLAQGRSA